MASRASTPGKQGRNKLISANASSSPKTNNAAQVDTQSHESELSQSLRRHSPTPLSPPPPPPSLPLPTWTVHWVITINDKESLKGASTPNCFRYQDWNTSAIDFVDGQTQGKEVKKQKTIAVVSCLGKSGFQASETSCEDDHEWGNVTELVKSWLKEKRKSVVVDIQRTVEVEQSIISSNNSDGCQPDTYNAEI